MSVCCARRGVFLLNMVELLPFLLGSCLVSRIIILMKQWYCSAFRLVSLALFAATFVIHVLASIDLSLFFQSDPFLVVAGAFLLY